MIISEAVVWGSKFGLSDLLEPMLEDEQSALMLYISAGVIAVIIGAIVYFMPRIDWSKYLARIFPWAVEDEEDKDEK